MPSKCPGPSAPAEVWAQQHRRGHDLYKAQRAARRAAAGDAELYRVIMAVYLLAVGRSEAEVQRALADSRPVSQIAGTLGTA